jgi:hypothetical protein
MLMPIGERMPLAQGTLVEEKQHIIKSKRVGRELFLKFIEIDRL